MNFDHDATRDLERSILGAILLDPDQLAPVQEHLGADDFGHPAHGVIFDAMHAVDTRGEPLDVVTLAHALRRVDKLQAVGGTQYLGELTDGVPTTAHVLQHAKLVRAAAERRRAVATYRDAARALAGGAGLDEVRRAVATAELNPNSAYKARRIGETLSDVLEVFHERAAGKRAPLTTPWPTVNGALGGGLLPGVHFLVGGTGSGKTQWALQVALEVANAGKPVVYIGLELGPEDLTARVLALQTGEAWSTLFRGTDPDALGRAIREGEKAVRGLPLWLEFAPPFGWQADRMLSLARAHRPALLVLDFLQVVAPLDAREDPRVRVGRVAYLARALGRDLGVAVLVLSSTARGNYKQVEQAFDDVRAGDLIGTGKESGEVEYSADTLMVLGRDTTAERGAKMWVAIAKQRAGASAVVPLVFDGHRFDVPRAPETQPTTKMGRR